MCIFTFLIQSKLKPNKNAKDLYDQNEYFIFGYIVTVCKLVYLIFREISQFLAMKRMKDYIHLENVMDWAVIIPTIVYLITIWFDTKLALNAGVWAMLLGWLNLTFYFGAFPLFGTVIHAIYNITLTLISVIWVVLPIVAGFMLFFRFTFATEDGTLQDFRKTLLKTVAMMLGNIDIEDFYSNPTRLNSTSKLDLSMGSNEVGIFCFMIFICIVIVNVMIGLTVNRINELLENAQLIRLEKTYNACQGFCSVWDTINKIIPCCCQFTDNSWKQVEVSFQPKESKLTTIFSFFLRAQGLLDNGAKNFEHYATVYSKDSRSTEIALPVWVFQKAKKICEKHEELAKKDKDVTDNARFIKKTQEQLQLQNTEMIETICQLERVSKNRWEYIISTMPDKNVPYNKTMCEQHQSDQVMLSDSKVSSNPISKKTRNPLKMIRARRKSLPTGALTHPSNDNTTSGCESNEPIPSAVIGNSDVSTSKKKWRNLRRLNSKEGSKSDKNKYPSSVKSGSDDEKEYNEVISSGVKKTCNSRMKTKGRPRNHSGSLQNSASNILISCLAIEGETNEAMPSSTQANSLPSPDEVNSDVSNSKKTWRALGRRKNKKGSKSEKSKLPPPANNPNSAKKTHR